MKKGKRKSPAESTATRNVVELRSGTFRNCPVCGSAATHVKGSKGVNPTMEEKINHVLAHGYMVLHIGQETVDGLNGEPSQETVAFLGK
jgi:hypothetical protein